MHFVPARPRWGNSNTVKSCCVGRARMGPLIYHSFPCSAWERTSRTLRVRDSHNSGISPQQRTAALSAVTCAGYTDVLRFSMSANRLRHSWLIICLAFLVVVIIAGAVILFYAPLSVDESGCRICGLDKTSVTVLGIKWWERDSDSDTSQWYRNSGLHSHPHEWIRVCGRAREKWGGTLWNYDCFPFLLEAPWRFQDASSKMDKVTFEEFAKEYYAIGDDRAKCRRFIERLEKYLPPSEPPEDEQL